MVALIEAVQNGNVVQVERLLFELHLHTERVNEGGGTPLILSAIKGNYACASALIDAGANLNAQDNFGNTALMFASKEGHEEVVNLLIQNGAFVDKRNNFGQTAIDMAQGQRVRTLLYGHRGARKRVKLY